MLKLYNTLTKKKEFFKPLHSKKAAHREPRAKERVNLFVCGPTVYDYAHIGHARTYIAFDIIARYLRQCGYVVQYVQNITDIEDKIIARAKERGITPQKLARDMEEAYYADMQALGITSVHAYVRATDHIFDIVTQVQKLASRGHAYIIEGDGYYFDLKSFPAYGKLSGRTREGAEDAVSRIDQSAQKRNRGDFCLWKFSKTGEPAWKTKLGAGRPGWHIEDTAITEAHFGPQYDIHGGARDLIFPHHEAEIAQMESASGLSPLAKYWMHTGFLTIGGKKMSKSLGNFITIRDFLKKYPPETLRMLVASTHYRSPIDYSEKVAQQAEERLRRMREFTHRIKNYELRITDSEADKGRNGRTDSVFQKLEETQEKFYREMDDDFNTPKALATLLVFIRYVNTLVSKKKISSKTAETIAEFFKTIDGIFGFNLFATHVEIIPIEVQKLADQREMARKNINWAEADRLRKVINALGYAVDDTSQGPRIKKVDKNHDD